MNKTIWLLLLLLLTLAASIGVSIAETHHRQELCELQKLVDAVQNERIADLEKDVRILKTDVHIIQYGFEDEYEKADNSR